MTYRKPELIFQDVWNWDIVIVHGRVKILGHILTHIDHCVYLDHGIPCTCQDGPILSSPIVDRFEKPLSECTHEGALPTSEAEYLLNACEGTHIRVMSGKTYRLRGLRKVDSAGFAAGSIFHAYSKASPSASRWQRFIALLKGAT